MSSKNNYGIYILIIPGIISILILVYSFLLARILFGFIITLSLTSTVIFLYLFWRLVLAHEKLAEKK